MKNVEIGKKTWQMAAIHQIHWIFYCQFLNQACTGRSTWFLKIDPVQIVGMCVRVCVCVCVCVCVRPLGY